MNLKNGQIYYIDFNGNRGREINNIHLGVIYRLPSIKDVVLCIPLTSLKIKQYLKIILDKNKFLFRKL